jgi:hypothetical protein
MDIQKDILACGDFKGTMEGFKTMIEKTYREYRATLGIFKAAIAFFETKKAPL